MDATREQNDPHLLDEWMVRRQYKPPRADLAPGLRFALYGRTSTVGHQDRASSHGWQREAADSLVAGHGAVVVEFFDAGCSRRLPWSARPEAAALLAELDSPERRFDAVVIGEYERAFYGDQFVLVAGLLNGLGVQVWLPEAGGPVRLADPLHRALVTVLGAQSQRESSGRGTGCWRRCARRRASRVATWVAGLRTDIGSSMPVHIRIGRTRAGDGGCGAWSRIR